jgi:hypothetical protein
MALVQPPEIGCCRSSPGLRRGPAPAPRRPQQLGRLADGVINRQPLSLRSPHGGGMRAARPPARFAHQADGPPRAPSRTTSASTPSELQLAGGFQPYVVLVTCLGDGLAGQQEVQAGRRAPGLEPGASVALRRLTAGVLARKESDPTHRPRYGRESTGRIPGSPRLLGAARRGSEDVCSHGARFCGWPGLSLPRLRRSTARDRRAVKRAASAAAEGGAERPDLDGPAARATIVPTS